MSKLGFIADVHIGNFKADGGDWQGGLNQRGRMTLDTLRAAIEVAHTQELQALMVAGDLFQSRRPEPAIIAGVQKVFSATHLLVAIIPGNHDMLDASCAEGNTACETLAPLVTIINKPQWFEVDKAQVLAIPFQGGMPMTDWLESTVHAPDDLNRPTVLLTHVGVYDDSSHPWCATASDAIHVNRLFDLMAKYGVRNAFVGNFHNMRQWSREVDGHMYRVIQCGTLCPHGHGDAGVYPNVGALWVYDTDTDEVHPVEVQGPRFVTTANERVMAWNKPGDESMEVMTSEPLAEKVESGATANLPQAQDAESAIAAFIGANPPPDVDIEEATVRTMALWTRAGGEG